MKSVAKPLWGSRCEVMVARTVRAQAVERQGRRPELTRHSACSGLRHFAQYFLYYLTLSLWPLCKGSGLLIYCYTAYYPNIVAQNCTFIIIITVGMCQKSGWVPAGPRSLTGYSHLSPGWIRKGQLPAHGIVDRVQFLVGLLVWALSSSLPFLPQGPLHRTAYNRAVCFLSVSREREW